MKKKVESLYGISSNKGLISSIVTAMDCFLEDERMIRLILIVSEANLILA